VRSEKRKREVRKVIVIVSETKQSLNFIDYFYYENRMISSILKIKIMTKPTKVTIVSILFLIVFLADIWGIVNQNKSAVFVFKPLLMTLLAILYLVAAKKPSFWYISALFFSFSVL